MDFDPKLIATIGTSFITSLATKGISGPAETINDLWKAYFGYPIHYFSEKRRIKYEFNLKSFEKELTDKILEIPKENIQEPKESIIGPALEASKHHFDEKEIREMFANLIASSMDSTYNGLVQHSFVEIIKQLSPHDAKLFQNFSEIEALVSLIKTTTEGHINSITKNLYFNQTFPDFTLNEISIDNLSRLGLINIKDDAHLTANSRYEHYNKIAPTYSSFEVPNDSKCCIKKYLEITSLGKAFKKVCIKDSL